MALVEKFTTQLFYAQSIPIPNPIPNPNPNPNPIANPIPDPSLVELTISFTWVVNFSTRAVLYCIAIAS